MTTDDFSVAFHIGAHKTATSHLQRSLLVQADALADVGVRYCGPEQFRLPGRTIAALFGLKARKKPRPNQRPPRDQLMLLRKGADRLLLSEENYMGVLNSPRRQVIKRRYPHAAQRITDLANAMEVDGIDVFLGIRHPTAFLNSAYGQLLLGGRVMPAARYQQLNPIESVNWLDLVKRLRNAAGVRSVTVWAYEDYGQVFDQISASLVGPKHAHLVQPLKRRIHVSLSAEAVAQVHADFADGHTDRAGVDARKTWPVEQGYAPFDGYGPQDHLRASERYAAQIAGIRDMADVTFLQA